MFDKKQVLEKIESRVLFASDPSIVSCIDNACSPFNEVIDGANYDDGDKVNRILFDTSVSSDDSSSCPIPFDFVANGIAFVSDQTHNLTVNQIALSLESSLKFVTNPLSSYAHIALTGFPDVITFFETQLGTSTDWISSYTHAGVQYLPECLGVFKQTLSTNIAFISDVTHQNVIDEVVSPVVFDYSIPALKTSVSWTCDLMQSISHDYVVPFGKFSFEKGINTYDWLSENFSVILHAVSDFVHEKLVSPVVDQANHTSSYLTQHPYETAARILYAGINNGIPVVVSLGTMVAVKHLLPDNLEHFNKFSAPVFFGAQAARFFIDRWVTSHQDYNEELKIDQKFLIANIITLGAVMTLPTHPLDIGNPILQSIAFTFASLPFNLNMGNDLLQESTFAAIGRTMDENRVAYLSLSLDDIKKAQTYQYPETQGIDLVTKKIIFGESRKAIMEWLFFKSS